MRLFFANSALQDGRLFQNHLFPVTIAGIVKRITKKMILPVTFKAEWEPCFCLEYFIKPHYFLLNAGSTEARGRERRTVGKMAAQGTE